MERKMATLMHLERMGWVKWRDRETENEKVRRAKASLTIP